MARMFENALSWPQDFKPFWGTMALDPPREKEQPQPLTVMVAPACN